MAGPTWGIRVILDRLNISAPLLTTAQLCNYYYAALHRPASGPSLWPPRATAGHSLGLAAAAAVSAAVGAIGDLGREIDNLGREIARCGGVMVRLVLWIGHHAANHAGKVPAEQQQQHQSYMLGISRAPVADVASLLGSATWRDCDLELAP